ncbi:MAG: hypothetical protein Q9160_003443 [Pyrenula sp. 1 TL-2023]
MARSLLRSRHLVLILLIVSFGPFSLFYLSSSRLRGRGSNSAFLVTQLSSSRDPSLSSHGLPHDYTLSSPSRYQAADTSSSTAAQRVGLVSLWHGSHLSPFNPSFLHTVSLHPDILSLLFLNVAIDKAGCADPPSLFPRYNSANTSSYGNVHIVCLTEPVFFDLIAEFLCSDDFWACKEDEARELVRREVPRRGSNFTRNMGLTYRPLMLPAVKKLWPSEEEPEWVGWTDTDVMFGRVEQFLDDLMRDSSNGQLQTDILTFTVDGIDSWLLYLRGQLTIFRSAAQVHKVFLKGKEWAGWREWAEGFKVVNDGANDHRGDEEAGWSSMLIDIMAEEEATNDIRWLQMVGWQGGDQSMMNGVIHEGRTRRTLWSKNIGLWEVAETVRREKINLETLEKEQGDNALWKSSRALGVSRDCPDHFIKYPDLRRCVYPIPGSIRGRELHAILYQAGKATIFTTPYKRREWDEKLFEHFLWVKYEKWMRVPRFEVEDGWKDHWVYEVDTWGQTRVWQEKEGVDVIGVTAEAVKPRTD